MPTSAKEVNVYLEVGQKRIFAGAINWPGWCRSGGDKDSALQALLEAGPRYARVLRTARLGFQPGTDISAFAIVERIKGNATTDFGAPGMIPSADGRPVNEAELKRLQSILKACWRAFDSATKNATGHSLRKGPRGGGRDVEGIIHHVTEAEAGYLSQLGWKFERNEIQKSADALKILRQEILKGLVASAHGEIPARGPRGGLRWPPRYFVRRSAWHILDHLWEIEDRLQPEQDEQVARDNPPL